MSVRGRPKGKRRPGPTASLSRSLSTALTLNGGLARTKSNAPDGLVRIVVVAVDVAAVADVALQAVHGEVHAAQAPGLVGLLDAEDGELGRRGSSCARRRSARDCTNMPPEPQAGSRMRPWKGSRISTSSARCCAGRVELAALLPLGPRELAEEVLVDAAEGVVVERGGNLGDLLQQLLEQRAVEELVGLGQHAGELRVVLLDVRASPR